MNVSATKACSQVSIVVLSIYVTICALTLEGQLGPLSFKGGGGQATWWVLRKAVREAWLAGN